MAQHYRSRDERHLENGVSCSFLSFFRKKSFKVALVAKQSFFGRKKV
jgi:hypothetical protein